MQLRTQNFIMDEAQQGRKGGAVRLEGPKANGLTLSPPIPLRLHALPYWCNRPFLIFDIWALWRSGLSARAPECQKLKVVDYTSMALNSSNSSNLKHLALKGLSALDSVSCYSIEAFCTKQLYAVQHGNGSVGFLEAV